MQCGCSKKDARQFYCFCEDEDGDRKPAFREKSKALAIVDKPEETVRSEDKGARKLWYRYGSIPGISLGRIHKSLHSAHIMLNVFLKENESVQMYLSSGTSSEKGENFPGIFFPRPEAGRVTIDKRGWKNYKDSFEHDIDIPLEKTAGWVTKCLPKDLWFADCIAEELRSVGVDISFKLKDQSIESIQDPTDIHRDSYRGELPFFDCILPEQQPVDYKEHKKTLSQDMNDRIKQLSAFLSKFCYWRDVQISACLGGRIWRDYAGVLNRALAYDYVTSSDLKNGRFIQRSEPLQPLNASEQRFLRDVDRIDPLRDHSKYGPIESLL
tara:strand:- start:357 stop:1331 length:975 start_codon:yes stop_codon:yes gene_type:complete